MLVIRLSRTGRKKQPYYRVVVAEKSAPIKGRSVEVLGHFNPRTKELVIDNERAKKRLDDGAQPSQTAEALLEKAGVLKRGKIVRTPERKPRKELKAEAEAGEKPSAVSSQPKTEDSEGKEAEKAEEPKADAAPEKTEEPKAEGKPEVKAEAPKPEKAEAKPTEDKKPTEPKEEKGDS